MIWADGVSKRTIRNTSALRLHVRVRVPRRKGSRYGVKFYDKSDVKITTCQETVLACHRKIRNFKNLWHLYYGRTRTCSSVFFALTFVSGKQSARLSARRNSPLEARSAAYAARLRLSGGCSFPQKAVSFSGAPSGRSPNPLLQKERLTIKSQ